MEERPRTSLFLSWILYDPARAFNFEALVIIDAITTAVIRKNCPAEISLRASRSSRCLATCEPSRKISIPVTANLKRLFSLEDILSAEENLNSSVFFDALLVNF